MSAKLERRGRKAPVLPLFTLDDLLILAKLPVFVAAALILPERSWGTIARGSAWFAGFVSREKIRRIRKGLVLLGRKPCPDPVRVLAQQDHHNIEVLNSYLTGGQQALLLDGVEHLERARAAGRGAVLWIAHFSFNALASKAALANAGFSVYHISRPEHGFTKSRFGIRFLNPTRVRAEMRHLTGRIVIDRDRPSASMAEARRMLKENAFVSITAGAWEGQLVAKVAIGGGQIEIATGAPRLAQIADAPLIPVFTIHDEETCKTRVIVEAPIPLPSGVGRDAMIMSASDEFAARHLPYIERHPLQWRDWEKVR
jgi:lauroyl/myristoyl acyltransferase